MVHEDHAEAGSIRVSHLRLTVQIVDIDENSNLRRRVGPKRPSRSAEVTLLCAIAVLTKAIKRMELFCVRCHTLHRLSREATTLFQPRAEAT